MKLRHYSLWALALAFTAVSCSDELDNSGKGNENSNGNGGYFMTVNIASDGSISTKASNNNGAGWGEEGNGPLTEIENEDLVHDVNIFLFELGAINDSDPLEELNKTENATKPIAGRGHKKLETPLKPGSSSEPNHGKVTIEMTMNDQLTADEKTYQVFTVVNAGSAITDIQTLTDLRDWIYKNAVWSTNDENKADKFIMSTHQMKGQSAGKSEVSISNANTKDNPANTTVYVERLAARIDMKVAEGLKAGTSTATGGTIANNGTFQLNKYIVVNQWNGYSYMIKQVSPTVDNETKDIPSTAYTATDPHKYLGDEKWDRTNTETGAGTYNYVIEPKTTAKDGTDYMSTSYINHFGPNTDAANLNNTSGTDTKWQGITNIATDAFTPVLYTKENTTDRLMQRNGYSTGVIFESEFTPGDGFKVSKYENGAIKNDVTLTEENKSFFVALHTTTGGDLKNVVYADVKTIAAMAFDGITDMTADMYKAFMGDEGASFPEGTDLGKVKTLISGMKDDNKVEAAFKKYLSDIANAEGAKWDDVKDILNYTQFQASETGLKLVEGTDKTAYSVILSEEFGVSYYQEGKSYHKFWIRHNDNGNPNKMGVMEFAIVRNNVYQLGVTGIRDLGDPLPYTPGKDDPDNPDENTNITINVQLYVKDWVVRDNGNIIL